MTGYCVHSFRPDGYCYSFGPQRTLQTRDGRLRRVTPKVWTLAAADGCWHKAHRESEECPPAWMPLPPNFGVA